MNKPEQQILFERLKPYYKLIESTIAEIPVNPDIPLFYDPIRYFLDIPGKRIRPLLVLLSTEVLGSMADSARYAAAAVELLHDFTLVHDDIMDHDETRRGQATIHTKWDMSTAILAGDGLMGFAFQLLRQSPTGNVAAMARRFTDDMIVICEGQGQDKMFEQGTQVSDRQYLEMISRKTAVLIELSCELGAMCANASATNLKLFKDFGHALGMGFQIQDDVLDIFGDSRAIGKKVGSDWLMHKQTILSIALQQRFPEQDIYALSLKDFQSLLQSSGVRKQIEEKYIQEFTRAEQILQQFPESAARDLLYNLFLYVRQREV